MHLLTEGLSEITNLIDYLALNPLPKSFMNTIYFKKEKKTIKQQKTITKKTNTIY